MMLSGSDSVLAVAKVADRYKTPVLALTASHPDITKHSPLVSQFNFDDTFQATVAALFVRDELLLDRVAILTQSDNAHFSYLAKQFAHRFTAVEGWITDTIELTTNEDDYVTILESIKIRDPELLYLPVPVEQIFLIVLALEKLEWNPKIMVSDGLLSSVLAQDKYPLNLVDGILATDTFHSNMELTEFGEQLIDKTSSLNISWQVLNTHSLLGMEGYAFLANAMNRCDDPGNRRCINARIRSTTKFEGIMGFISIDAKGKAHRPLVINNIYDGKMNFMVKVY